MKRMTRRATRSASPSRPQSSASPNFPDDGSGDKRKLAAIETDSSKRPLKRRNNHSKESTDEAPIKNNDFCSSCGFVGRFLCCDACPKAFHFTCVDPPMDDSDVEHLEGEWYCRECEHKRSSENSVPTPPPFPAVTALFHRMIQDLDSRNPVAYRPPIEIINYFEGVSMDKVGQYVDSSAIKPVRHKSGPQADLYDERRLKDAEGNIIVCFRCRKSALHGRMITCDYCPLSWHMDCVDPPMVSMPNPARKWMCPTHVEHVLPRMRQKRRSVLVDPAPGSGDSDEDDEVSEQEEAEQVSTARRPSVAEGNPMIKYNQTVYRLPYESFKLGYPTSLSHLSPMTEDEELPTTEEETRICAEGIAEIQSALARFAQEDSDVPEEERSMAMLVRAVRLLDNGDSDDDDGEQSPAEHVEPEPMELGKNKYEAYIANNKILREKGKNPLWNILNNSDNDSRHVE